MAGSTRRRSLVAALAALPMLTAIAVGANAQAVPAMSPASSPASGATATLAPTYTSTTGDLRVSVVGLPTGVAATIKLYRSGVLKYTLKPKVGYPATQFKLVPGSWVVKASTVTTTNAGKLAPTVFSRTVSVKKATVVSTSFTFKPAASASGRLTVASATVSTVAASTASTTYTATVTNRSKLKYLSGFTLTVPKGVTALSTPRVTVPSARGTWRAVSTACTAGAACTYAYTVTVKPKYPTLTSAHLRYGESAAIRLTFTAPATAAVYRFTPSALGGTVFTLDGSAPSMQVVKGVTTVLVPAQETTLTVPVTGSATTIAADLPNGAYGPVSVYYEPTTCTPGQTGSCVTATVDGTFSGAQGELYGFGISPEIKAPASLSSTCSKATCPRVSTAMKIAAGNAHTCVMRTDGSVWCMGSNQYGQLGTVTGFGDATGSATPVRVTGLPAVSQIVSGYDHTCAVAESGALWCWGKGGQGQLGSGTANSWAPVQVPTLTGVTGVASGNSHTCAIANSVIKPGVTAVWCWGGNQFGQAAVDGVGTVAAPTEVITEGGPYSLVPLTITAGYDHTCLSIAVYSKATVQCWGSNQYGQLGVSTNVATPVPNPIPLEVPGVTPYTVAAGGNVSCDIESGTLTVNCWGSDAQGTLGPPHLSSPPWTYTPRPVYTAETSPGAGAPLNAVYHLTVGSGGHACASVDALTAWCWGSNASGQAGVDPGTATTVQAAAPVTTPVSNGLDITAGGAHTCITRASSDSNWNLAPYCWGSNAQGQLGIPMTTTATFTPSKVTGYYDDERVADYYAYPMQVSLKINGAYVPYGTSPMCSDISMIDSIAGQGMIATADAQAKRYCYDVGVSTRPASGASEGALTRVILFAEDPKFTPISR